MNKNGLIVEPDFDNVEKYLKPGHMTEYGDKLSLVIREFNKSIKESGNLTDGMIVRKVLLWINNNINRLNNLKDGRKFKRTAEEILVSRERTGCADSATLFTAIARGLGIPTMQIITLDKEWAMKTLDGEKKGIVGHYFVACYFKNIDGIREWNLIDSDKKVRYLSDVQFFKLNLENRNINNKYYAFAYVNDYSELSVTGITADSIHNMGRIQLKALKLCDTSDFEFEERIELL